jgi:hypothetical protein
VIDSYQIFTHEAARSKSAQCLWDQAFSVEKEGFAHKVVHRLNEMGVSLFDSLS